MLDNILKSGSMGGEPGPEGTGGGPPPGGDALLLESGDYILLESGDKILLE